jgi:hypothetical protein
LPAVAEMTAVAAAAKGAAIQYVEGGGEDADEESDSNHGGGDDGHGTDEESKSSNPHPPNNNNGPAIFQIDVYGTLSVAISRYHSQQNNSKNDIIIHGRKGRGGPFAELLSYAASATASADDGMMAARGKKEKCRRQVLEERATKICDARKRYFERRGRGASTKVSKGNGCWEGATLSLLALRAMPYKTGEPACHVV